MASATFLFIIISLEANDMASVQISRGGKFNITQQPKKKKRERVAIISGAAISLGVNTSCPAIFTRNSAKKRRDATRLLPFSMRQNGQGMSHPERRLSIKAH